MTADDEDSGPCVVTDEPGPVQRVLLNALLGGWLLFRSVLQWLSQ